MESQHDVDNPGGNPWGIVSSAIVGAVVGYLLTTPKGRRLCDATIQLLDNFSYECARFCQASARAQIAAADGWRAMEGNLLASKRAVAGQWHSQVS